MSWEYWGEWEQRIDPEGYRAYLARCREYQRMRRVSVGDAAVRALIAAHGETGEITLGQAEDVLQPVGLMAGGARWLNNALARSGAALRVGVERWHGMPMDVEGAVRDWLAQTLVRSPGMRCALSDLDERCYSEMLKRYGDARAACVNSWSIGQLLRSRGDTLRRGARGMMLLDYRLR